MGVEEFVRRCEDGARHGGGEGVRCEERGTGGREREWASGKESRGWSLRCEA